MRRVRVAWAVMAVFGMALPGGAAGASVPVTAIDWERAQTVQTGVKFVALDEVVDTPVTASDEKMLNLFKN